MPGVSQLCQKTCSWHIESGEDTRIDVVVLFTLGLFLHEYWIYVQIFAVMDILFYLCNTLYSPKIWMAGSISKSSSNVDVNDVNLR